MDLVFFDSPVKSLAVFNFVVGCVENHFQPERAKQLSCLAIIHPVKELKVTEHIPQPRTKEPRSNN